MRSLIFEDEMPPSQAVELFSKTDADNVLLLPIMADREERSTDVGTDFQLSLRSDAIGLALGARIASEDEE